MRTRYVYSKPLSNRSALYTYSVLLIIHMTRTARLKTLGELSTPKAKLHAICDQLNRERDTEHGQELVKLISEWIAASSLQEMQHNNPAPFLDVLRSNTPLFFDTSEKKKYGVWRASPAPSIEGDHHSFTVWMLSHLFVNPLNEKLKDHVHGVATTSSRKAPRKTSTRNEKQSLKDGTAGIRRQTRPDLLSTAAAEWQQSKHSKWSPKMLSIVEYSAGHLLPVLGKMLPVDTSKRATSRHIRPAAKRRRQATGQSTSKSGCSGQSCANTACGRGSLATWEC